MLVPEGGLRQAAAGERAALTGAQWQALEQALGTGHSPQAYTATLRAAAPVALALKSQLRTLLQYHCGNPLLRTRQLMMDLQNL
ncbi:DNA repair protein RecO [compost metagenome]